jgi:hypothetical protein
MATFPPPWESGPGPADPAISSGFGSYTSSGYGKVGQGTINVGNPISVPAQPPPAQVRFYVQSGILYALDNLTGQAFPVNSGATVPRPPVYSPTK